jgi:6-pyruvoyltetrahydropterin/6-carboxytetrahydropterin synthase
MFEVGTTTRFRALHCMPAQPFPENEQHSHEYSVDVVAERERLDERGMVCDLDVLSSCLRDVVDRARDRDLSEVCGADAVTVEFFAAWIHAQLAGRLRADGAESLSVRVWESEDAFGGVRERL